MNRKIKSLFHALGYEISIRTVSKKHAGFGRHIIDYKSGEDWNRLGQLVVYYFGDDVQSCSYCSWSVILENFNDGGHGIEGICKKCGCTEMDACHDDLTGSCWWVTPDLCSACATTDQIGEAITDMKSLND